MPNDVKGEPPQIFLEVPLEELIETYQRLAEYALKLNKAKQLRSSGASSGDVAKNALNATIEFINSVPATAGKALHLPLTEVLWGLVGLDDGVLKPIFKRSGGLQGGTLREKERDMFYAYVSAIANKFPGKKSMLAKRLTEGGHRTRKGGRITVEQIRQWGRDLEKLRPTDYRRERYDAACKGLSDLTAESVDGRIAYLN